MAHKKFNPPKVDGYIPLQVGAALHDDLGYLRDDAGENISIKNPNYAELTGLYYIWKNDHDSDIIGTCHYRRYFFEDDFVTLLSVNHIEKILDEYDMIVPFMSQCEKSIREKYYEAHHKEDMIALENAVKKIFPDYVNAFEVALDADYVFYCNMLIAKREIFNAYCSFLFPILFETEKNRDISGYDDYQKRVFGFLAERMLNVFILKNNLNVYQSYIYTVPERAEGSDVFNVLEEDYKCGNFAEGEEKIKEYNEKYPDLFYEERFSQLIRKIHFRYAASKAEECEKNGDISSAIEWAKVAIKFADK